MRAEIIKTRVDFVKIISVRVAAALKLQIISENLVNAAFYLQFFRRVEIYL